MSTVSQVASGFAGQLQSALTGATGTESTATPVNLTATVSSLAARIRSLLSAEGIALDSSITVSQDQFDRLRVSGRHPQKDRIESILAGSPELGDAFRELANRLLVAQSTGTAGETPAAYDHEGKTTFDLGIEPFDGPRHAGSSRSG